MAKHPLPYKEFLSPLRKTMALRTDKENKANGQKSALSRRRHTMKITLAPLTERELAQDEVLDRMAEEIDERRRGKS